MYSQVQQQGLHETLAKKATSILAQREDLIKAHQAVATTTHHTDTSLDATEKSLQAALKGVKASRAALNVERKTRDYLLSKAGQLHVERARAGKTHKDRSCNWSASQLHA